MSKKITDPVKPITFRCKGCRKDVEVPYCAAPGYGWWFGRNRYCSYSCMREAEKKRMAQLAAKNPYARDMRTNTRAASQRLATYAKLVKFLALCDEGMTQKEAAAQSGFPSVKAASSAKHKYKMSEEYCKWLENRKQCLADAR